MNWIIWSFAAIFFWGIAFFFGKIANKSGLIFRTYLFEIFGVILTAFVFFAFYNNVVRTLFISPGWKYDAPALGMGIFLGIGTLSFLIALMNGRAAITVPLTATYPLITVACAMIFLHESLTWKEMVGILITTSGIALLSSGGK